MSGAASPDRDGVAWRAGVLVAADTALLGLAAWWSVWTSAYGLWVWTALCLTWMADVLGAARQVRLLLAGLAAVLGARAALVLGLGTLRPTVSVAVAALAVVVAAVVLLVLRPALRAVPVRLRRPLVAFLGVAVVLVATAAGAAHATGRWGLLLAAVLLSLADLLGLHRRFVRRSWQGDAAGLPLRYAALVLLAHP